MSGQLQTPVVFIVFNRPVQTSRVFERISQVKPKHLLVIADGARADRPEEKVLCEETRRIATSVTWPCEVETNFAPRNMGCRDRLISGLNWAFEQVEEAIILEDDVLPDPSFFPFCEQMLDHYREDTRISMVAGFNIVENQIRTDSSYFFSNLTRIWGWATWRRSWARYDEYLVNWPAIKSAGLLNEIFDRPEHVKYWTTIFDLMHDGTGPNTWDYQWAYTNFIHNALSIVPRVNLIENIGFGPGATHTTELLDAPKVTAGSLDERLIHPLAVVPLRSRDQIDMARSGCQAPTLAERIARKIRRSTMKALARSH